MQRSIADKHRGYQPLTDQHKQPLSPWVKATLGLVLAVLAWVFVTSPIEQPSRWDLIKKRGSLLYGTRISLLSYFNLGDDNIVGYEYQLLKAFCDQHQIKLEPIVYQNNGAMFADLNAGRLDVAGGHLTVTAERQQHHDFTRSISQTAVNLVTHFEFRSAKSLAEFESDKGMIIADSSYQETLNQLPDFKPSDLQTTDQFSLFELISKINSKEIDYTFGDSEIINIYQYFVPGLYQPLQLAPPTDTAFMLPKDRSVQLLEALNAFIDDAEKSGLVSSLKNEMVNYLPEIDTANTVTFFDKIQTTWPSVKDLVFQVAEANDFDPAMLAAISYQESHWNADAVSFSGVKGLMMLTASTAREVGVEDRTDPLQSLIGGIKYFRLMHDKIPARIAEPDRTLFALAAYNIGYGHLEDARILTQKAGQDPDSWLAVEPFLAQLNNPALAHELKRGNADGKTAVIYVNNIMTYKQLMTWKINKEETAVASNSPVL